MTRTPQQIGKANRRAGKEWQMACAAWLRDHGYPHASYEVRNGVGDILGVGDINVECGDLDGWDKTWIKMGQSLENAERRQLDDYCYWKKKQGKTDPGCGLVMLDPAVFWRMRADLDAYVHAEMEYELAYEKGYAAGYRAKERGE